MVQLTEFAGHQDPNLTQHRAGAYWPHSVKTMPLFRMVGMTLGEEGPELAEAHFTPRLSAALATLQRLRTLELPSSLCSLLWRTAVLPRALYGCEIRDLPVEKLRPLGSGGKAALGP